MGYSKQFTIADGKKFYYEKSTLKVKSFMTYSGFLRSSSFCDIVNTFYSLTRCDRRKGFNIYVLWILSLQQFLRKILNIGLVLIKKYL